MGQKEHFFHNTHDLELCLLVYFIVFPYIKNVSSAKAGALSVWLSAASSVFCAWHMEGTPVGPRL